MSTRDDATLSSEERAAFARIEAQAIADDPSLGASLLFRLEHKLRGARRALGHRAHESWVGGAVVAVGIALVAVGLATTVALSVLGVVAVVAGALPLAEVLRQRVEQARARAAAARQAPPDPTA
ncbi:MAG: DUF3040 domain-containing protein [Actinomycetota bacterium]|nr:DUF3040 domain-containing protein [Actinomycetota bacterium]